MHTTQYQKKFDSKFLLVKTWGCLAHDSGEVLEQGYSASLVDTVIENNNTIKYNAGADIKFVFVNNGGAVFTNNANITNKPPGQNQVITV